MGNRSGAFLFLSGIYIILHKTSVGFIMHRIHACMAIE